MAEPIVGVAYFETRQKPSHENFFEQIIYFCNRETHADLKHAILENMITVKTSDITLTPLQPQLYQHPIDLPLPTSARIDSSSYWINFTTVSGSISACIG